MTVMPGYLQEPYEPNRHVIGELLFDIDFGASERAQDDGEALAFFAGEKMKTAIDTVLSEASVAGAILRLDRIEIDLGVLDYDHYQETAVGKLKDMLEQAIREQTVAVGSRRKSDVIRMTQNEKDFKTLCHFLVYGRMPWTIPLREAGSPETWLAGVLEKNPSSLIDFLRRTPARETAIRRLALQFSPNLIKKLIDSSDSGTIEAAARNDTTWGAPEEIMVLLDALSASPSYVVRQQAMGRSFDASAATALLAEALLSGRIDLVGGIWAELVRNRAFLTRRIIKRYGVQSMVRRRMSTDFPEGALKDIVLLFEPLEHRFIEEIVDRPDLFRKAVKIRQEEQSVKARLWEFTLTYLFVERGSEFNRQNYMAGMLKQMAAHANLSLSDLMQSLHGVLESMETTGPFRNQLMSLLVRISEAEGVDLVPKVSPDEPQSPAADVAPIFHRFEEALSRGDHADVVELWPELLSKAPRRLQNVLRRHGLTATKRRLMAREYPDWLLKKIVILFEPLEHGFIEEIVDRPELFRQAIKFRQDAATVKVRLWEFTLTYLLVERGSEFNRRSYMAGVLKQMAAHSNSSLSDLVLSLRDVLECMETDSPFKKQLSELLRRISAAEGIEVYAAASPAKSDGMAESLRRFESALSRRDHRSVAELWPELVMKDSGLLRETLRRQGLSVAQRRLMAREYPAQLLKKIVFLFEPLEAPFIEEVLTRNDYVESLAAPVSQPPDIVRQLLWEFTLTYLMIDRGSEFNRQSYMKSVLRQMAAHAGMNYRDLLRAFRGSLIRSRNRSNFRSGLLVLIARIADEEGLSDKPADGQPARYRQEDSKWARGYELTDSLRYRMTRRDSKPVDASEISCLIGELISDHPVRLIFFLTDVICRWPDEILFSCSTEIFETLIRGYLRLTRTDLNPEDILKAFSRMPAGTDRTAMIAWLRMVVLQPDADPVELADEIAAGLKNEAGKKEIPADVSAVDSADALHNAGKSGEVETDTASGRERMTAETSLLKDKDNVPPVFAKHPEESIRELLTGSVFYSGTDAARLQELMERSLYYHPERLRALLLGILHEPRAAARMAEFLPESLLGRVLLLIRPAYCRRLGDIADMMTYSMSVLPGGAGVDIGRLKWEFMLHYFAGDAQFDEKCFVEAFAGFMEKRLSNAPQQKFRAMLRSRLALAPLSMPMAEVLRVMDLLAPDDREERNEYAAGTDDFCKTRASGQNDEEEFEDMQSIFVLNAGLVLAGAYLPKLFDVLGLLEKGGFADPSRAGRAVHLLQYMIDGRCNAPEHELMLNKLLCGIAPEMPVAAAIEITERERRTIDSLLAAMIANWQELRNTSVEGFRETFLKREGRLIFEDDAWNLLVQSRAFDMLLDRLPWSYSLIKQSWMRHAIHVEWRHGL